MGSTLLFVHGTGVRSAGYSATLGVIKQEVQRRSLPVAVRGCFWGDAEGARLAAGGQSIPDYEDTGGGEPSEEDKLIALWSVLYTDPWYELRLLRHAPVAGGAGFGEEAPSDLLRRAIREFTPSEALERLLADVGLAQRFHDALAALRVAQEFEQAVATAPPDPQEHRRALARAVVAHAVVASQDLGEPMPAGQVRDALVERMTDELHGYGMGVGEFLLRPIVGIAQRLVTRKLTRERGGITDAVSPAAGDILCFLANGDGARAYLRAAIADAAADGPVYLLAHSLGGIMCVDMLIREAYPDVAGLITIGSQAPFLYEIGALSALAHPDPLPSHFPAWLNVYDPRDALSYVGGRLWEGRVTDLRVDNAQPFPHSHSAYWTNDKMWAEISAMVA